LADGVLACHIELLKVKHNQGLVNCGGPICGGSWKSLLILNFVALKFQTFEASEGMEEGNTGDFVVGNIQNFQIH
jgi:hypothetical protein